MTKLANLSIWVKLLLCYQDISIGAMCILRIHIHIQGFIIVGAAGVDGLSSIFLQWLMLE